MCDSCNYSDSSSEGSSSDHSDSESDRSGSDSDGSESDGPCSGGSCGQSGNGSCGRSGNGSCCGSGGGNSCGRSGTGGKSSGRSGTGGKSSGRRRGGASDVALSFFRLGNGCSDGACSRPSNGNLPFDPTAIQDIILKLSDAFDLRVNMSSDQVKKAAMITSGLALAGSVIGKSFGGKMGAAIGGAVGGACGVGYTLVSLRDVWEDVWWKLSELFDITYDFLGGLGFDDYQTAMSFLLDDRHKGAHLASILAEVATSILGRNVIPSVMPQ